MQAMCSEASLKDYPWTMQEQTGGAVGTHKAARKAIGLSLRRDYFLQLDMLAKSAQGSSQNGWSFLKAMRAVEEWKKRLRLTDLRRYRPGSEVFAGTFYDSGFLIERGILALHYLFPDGRETLFMLAYPGEMVNLTALSRAEPMPTAVTAVTNCDVYRIEAHRMQTAERDDPEIPKLLNRSLQDQIAKRTKALVELKTLSPAERLERHLCELAHVLGCDIHAKPVRVIVPLKDTEMAMLLGLSVRQFKRVKKSLQEEGRLTLENSRVFVLPECR